MKKTYLTDTGLPKGYFRIKIFTNFLGQGRHQKKNLQNFTIGPKLPWPPYLLGHFTPEKFAPDL